MKDKYINLLEKTDGVKQGSYHGKQASNIMIAAAIFFAVVDKKLLTPKRMAKEIGEPLDKVQRVFDNLIDSGYIKGYMDKDVKPHRMVYHIMLRVGVTKEDWAKNLASEFELFCLAGDGNVQKI